MTNDRDSRIFPLRRSGGRWQTADHRFELIGGAAAYNDRWLVVPNGPQIAAHWDSNGAKRSERFASRGEALRALAVYYSMHPQLPAATTDPVTFGRVQAGLHRSVCGHFDLRRHDGAWILAPTTSIARQLVSEHTLWLSVPHRTVSAAERALRLVLLDMGSARSRQFLDQLHAPLF